MESTLLGSSRSLTGWRRPPRAGTLIPHRLSGEANARGDEIAHEIEDMPLAAVELTAADHSAASALVLHKGKGRDKWPTRGAAETGCQSTRQARGGFAWPAHAPGTRSVQHLRRFPCLEKARDRSLETFRARDRVISRDYRIKLSRQSLEIWKKLKTGFEIQHRKAIAPVLNEPRKECDRDTSLMKNTEYRLLSEWIDTRQDCLPNVCVPQLVAIRAAVMPDAQAIVAGDQTLTYHELNRRANQLGHLLRTLGVGPNVPVGCCIERSLDMVVGLLGILKAGGAYLPLDPTYPEERLSFMLEDAGVPVLVTRQHLRCPVGHIRTVCLDADAQLLAQQSEAEPFAAVSGDDLVYVIYTSGSTGRPKGVQIAHKSLLNLIFWHWQTFAVSSSDRATQIASPAFDAAGWELWPYLTAGASVYLPDEDTRTSAVLLRDWLVSRGITMAFLPTPLAESAMGLEWPSTTALRFLLTGGDVLRRYPPPGLPFAVINNYGPTETTVVATSGRVQEAEAGVDGFPAIGSPIANTRIYILDGCLQPVPRGTPGELYIGGVSVGRGYLNRPELTAERFLPDPFADGPGAYMYRTGDLARFLPDGQIAFMGRIDQQIKIRGYRIEPDEIVSVLNGHPAVQASLVVAREDVPGDKRLVAYIVLVPGVPVTASSLRELLAAHLPDYMIPSALVQLEALPLTTNGKVDRTALPAPDAANTMVDEIVSAPATPTEKRLVGLVAPLLGLERIGVDDNFFLLGGSSLMGAQLIMQVSESFGVGLTLRTLFANPTIRLLSTAIERLVLAKLETMSDDEIMRMLE